LPVVLHSYIQVRPQLLRLNLSDFNHPAIPWYRSFYNDTHEQRRLMAAYRSALRNLEKEGDRS